MAESNFSLQKTLTMLLDEKKYHSLRDILSTMNPADIAAIFDDLDQARLPLLFRLLPKELAAETFVEMEPEAQELLIQVFIHHFLAMCQSVPPFQDGVKSQLYAISGSFCRIGINISQRTCCQRAKRFFPLIVG